MITLHLVRHGETVWHAKGWYAGSSDVALTEEGRRQARALGPWGHSAGLSAIVTSDLSRAVLTGEALAEGAGLTPRIDPRVREVAFGEGEGLNHEQMAERFPDAYESWVRDPGRRALPGGETGDEALERSLPAIVEVLQSVEDGQAAAIVMHGTLIRLQLCHFLGIPPDDYRRRFPVVDNTAVATVQLPRVDEVAALADAGGLLHFNWVPPHGWRPAG